MSICAESREAIIWLRSLGREIMRRKSVHYLLLLAAGVVLGSGILLYLVEPNIPSPLTGMWYAWVTLTHVGFGDFVAVSLLGRAVSSVLILLGVGFFALSAGICASILVSYEMGQVSREFSDVERSVEEIENAETRILMEMQAMSRRLQEIETRLKQSRG